MEKEICFGIKPLRHIQRQTYEGRDGKHRDRRNESVYEFASHFIFISHICFSLAFRLKCDLYIKIHKYLKVSPKTKPFSIRFITFPKDYFVSLRLSSSPLHPIPICGP